MPHEVRIRFALASSRPPSAELAGVDTSVGALRLELSRVPLLQDLETAKLEMPRGCVAAVARGQRREGEQHTHMQELA